MKIVKRSELSSIKMVAGNEKKYSRVIKEGNVEHWIGFGWVTEGLATKADKKKYPTVED